MPKAKTAVKTKAPAQPAEPKPGTRKQLSMLLLHAAGLLDKANEELTAIRIERDEAQFCAREWSQLYHTSSADYRAQTDGRNALISELRKQLAESQECLRRACFYHHTTAVALQSAQHDAGQDSYMPIGMAVAQKLGV